MCGCCTSNNPWEYKNKYKEKDKGICKQHEHMLIYSNFYWKQYNKSPEKYMTITRQKAKENN